MKKLSLLLLSLALAAPAIASAACVTTQTGTAAWKIVCDSGNEVAAAPTTSATDGLPLAGMRAFSITAEAAAGQTFTATPSGTVAIYLYDPQVGRWGRCRSCSEGTISAASARTEPLGAWDVKGPGRLMLIPVSVTLSAGAMTLYVSGVR